MNPENEMQSSDQVSEQTEIDPLTEQVNALVTAASLQEAGGGQAPDQAQDLSAQQTQQAQAGLTPEALTTVLQTVMSQQNPQQNEALNSVLTSLAQGQNALSETIAKLSAPAASEVVDPLSKPIDQSAVIRGLSAEQQELLNGSDGLAELVVTLADNVSRERLSALGTTSQQSAPIEESDTIKALQAEIVNLRGSSFNNTLQAVNPDAYAKLMSPAGQAFMKQQNALSSTHTNQRFFDMQAGNNDVQGAINLLNQIPDPKDQQQTTAAKPSNVTNFPLSNSRASEPQGTYQITPKMLERLQQDVQSGVRPYSELETVEKMLARQQG